MRSRDRTARAALTAWILIASISALVLGPRRAEAGLFAWALEAEDTPAQLWVGTEVEVVVEIRNLGNHPWMPGLGDRLSYHWRSESGELLIRDGLRTPITEVVGSGETIELSARLRPPDQPGRYQLEWALVREGVTWFPPPRGGPVFHPITVEVGELGWTAARFSLPERLAAGEQVSVPVRVSNVGEVPWNPTRGDALAYHWWSDEGELWVHDGLRTALPERIEPGTELAITLQVAAPSHHEPAPRRMCLELEPLRERVRWFGPSVGDDAIACTLVEPDPLAWELLADATPTRIAIDDAELRVPLTVQNIGTEPWPDSDRLGYRWRSLASGELIDGPRTALPDDIDPGEIVELEPIVHPPAEPGEYQLIWGLVREGERWYPEPETASKTIEVVGRRLAWALLRAEPVSRLWADKTIRVELELQNLGTESWSEATGDHLAYHWLNTDGEVVEYDGRRTSFAKPVGPGERVVIEAVLRGPAKPGRYRLQWELVREHERWYGPPAQIGAGRAWQPDQLPRTRARGLAVMLALGFGLATVLGAVALRRRPPTGARTKLLVEQLPLLWAALAIWILVAAFHELSDIDPRRGASWITASGAWILVAGLALVRHRARAWLAAGLIVGLATLALADLVYMHYFGSIVPAVALTASHHLGEVSDSAVAELEGAWGWFAVVPIAGLIAAALWPATRIAAAEPPVDRKLRRAWLQVRPRLFAVTVCLALATPALVRLGVALSGKLGTRVFSEQAMVGRFGYVNAHLFDLARTVRERGRRGNPSPAERERIVAWFGEHAESVDTALARASEPAGVAAGHNLLLIQVEALQTWVIGLEVEGQEITPLLNRMREQADWYPYLIDQTNQGKTSDAEYAVLNSQHPLGEGAICFLRADNSFYTLAHVLAERGYATLSAHPYKRGFWNRAALHPRYGFARSLFRRELGDGQEVGWGLADGLFFERIMPEIQALPEPWFTFLITLSLHHPYDEFPENLAALELGALEGTRVGNYLQAMNYFDRSLANLLGQLDDAGLLDHTVVALYGDHDARFELDRYPEVLTLAGLGDWDPAAFARLERVPLFVRIPPTTRLPHGTMNQVGGHVDVGPTLLHALGIPRPRAFVGRPLVLGSEGESFAAYPDGSAYDRERMFVATGQGIPLKGGCFEFPEGDSRPRSECAALAERAAEELSISRAVVDHDLHRELD
ncbi:MAG TPA: sulfatase-like hydrolase/transferase [Enhygromyxa sp.]|nr:sulfatase-like hydrolase/transferase [Enhygromyxa sp.]